jgi:NodT family efflux transporter outer membrane factor (OMF) lipoprotein
VLVGCTTVGPDFKKPEVAVSDDWQEKGDSRINTQGTADAAWWKQFNDPTLDRLVTSAYKLNLSLQIAGLRIYEARAQLGVATGQQFPQIQVATGSFSAVGLSDNIANLNGIPGFSRNFVEYQLGFDAAWEIDFWGKYRRGIESETASLIGSVADYDSALVSLTAEVARTYVVIRTYEVLVEEAMDNAKIQEQGLGIAQSRFKNGATSELDVTQATTLLESTRATIPQLQMSLQQSKNALSTLLGEQPGHIDAMLEGPKAVPAASGKVAVSVPAEMLRRRPDIRGAELTAAAQCARIGVAKSELYPSFSLLGSFGIQATNTGGHSANLFSADSLYYSIGPRIVFPFLNYGRLENGVRVQDARFQELLVSYHETVLRAAREVEDALVGYLRSQEAVGFAQGAVKAAEKSVQLALHQYREGATDYQRVLDAERSLLQEENSLTQTSSSVATNLIALYKALGGGWELRQNQPVVPATMQEEMKQRTNWGDLLTQPP